MRRPRWTFAHATIWSALFIACSDDPTEERPAAQIEATATHHDAGSEVEPRRRQARVIGLSDRGSAR